MRYALIHPDSHVAAVQDFDGEPQWEYPEDFTLVQADGFEPDPALDLSVYLYADGAFSLDHERVDAIAPMEPFEVLSVLFATQPETIEQLPDESLARMAPYMEPWKAGAEYERGNVREYEEFPYRCEQSHTSQAGWEPPNVPALWTQIGKPGEIPEWRQPTGAQDAYMKGDKVRHNGKVWVSDVDSNVWEPGVYGWSEVV